MAVRDILAGSAVVAVGIKDRMAKGLSGIKARLQKFGTSLGNLGAKLVRGGALLGGLSAAAFTPIVAAARHFSQLGDEVHKMGIRTRASTEWLSEMGFASEQSGTSLSSLGAAIFRMNRRVANAATGTGPAVRALRELGLEAEVLSRMTTEQRFDAITDALGRMGNETRANQLGFELLGDNFRDLQPLLAEGSKGMQELRERARELGLTISQDDANGAAAFGDAQNELFRTASAAWRNIGAAVAPVLTRGIKLASGFVSIVTDWIGNNRGLFVSILGIVSGMAGLAAGMVTAGFAVMGIGAALTAAGSLISAIFSPIGAAVAVLVGAAVAVYVFRDRILEALAPLMPYVDAIRERVSRFGSILKRTFEGIVAAISAGDISAAVAIALKGLRAAYAEGLAQIGGLVERWLGSVGSAIIGGRWDLAVSIMWERIKLVILQGWNAVHRTWIGAQNLIGKSWDLFVLGLSTVWRKSYFGIARGFVFIADAALGIIRQLAPAIEALGFEELAKNLNSFSLKGIDGQLKQMEGEALARDRRAAQSRIKSREAELAAALQGDQRAENAQRNRIANLEKEAELAKQAAVPLDEIAAAAKADLEKAVQEAKEANQQAAKPETLEKLGEAARQGAIGVRKVSSSGTFSAAAAVALGAGSSRDRAMNETAKNTGNILSAIRRGNKIKQGLAIT